MGLQKANIQKKLQDLGAMIVMANAVAAQADPNNSAFCLTEISEVACIIVRPNP
jgi:hypothetical protein